MPKYTEEQLLQVKEEAYNPQPDILEAFNALVEEVREHEAKQKSIKWGNGDTYIDENGQERPYHHLNRRRGSRSGGAKPNLRKKSVETVVDEDGWATTVPTKKLFGAENEEERQTFRDTVKAKPNNKNLGSSKPVDPRDAIADVQKKAFNAFDALNSESDDDDDE